MKLRQIFTILTLTLSAFCSLAEEPLFQYPSPPDELTTLDARCDFIVERFWERCNVVTTLRAREQFKKAFSDYVSFMPYASAEVVHKSIEALLSRFDKDTDKLIPLAEIAEETLYSPDGEFVSDEVYLPFALAASKAKKGDSEKKKHFAAQAKILSQSQVNMRAPDFEYILPDGTKGRLNDSFGKYVLIFFDEPGNNDNFMARVRLQADSNVNDLIDKGVLEVYCIYPGKFTQDWANSTSTYNKRWKVGAAPSVKEIYDMRYAPVMYYLNGNHKILSKTFSADNLKEAFRRVNENYQPN